MNARCDNVMQLFVQCLLGTCFTVFLCDSVWGGKTTMNEDEAWNIIFILERCIPGSDFSYRLNLF